MNNFRSIDNSFPILSYGNLIKLLLYGNDLSDDNKYQSILIRTIIFLRNSQRFSEKLL